MGEPVLADAQFGIVKILRPFAGFESVYEGKIASIPIMFTELGEPLDPLAGTPGYSPRLLKGLSVPLGSRVVFWLPSIFAFDPNDIGTLIAYDWFVEWRLRNTFDYRQRRIPYHLGKQGAGVPDTTFPVGQRDRVVIPAASQSVVYNQAEPPLFQRVIQNIRVEAVATLALPVPLPFLPDGTKGEVQQGILDPTDVSDLATLPLFLPYEYQALGDEMLIGAFRSTSPVANWSFPLGGSDHLFSNLFGNGLGKTFPAIGVYALTGAAP